MRANSAGMKRERSRSGLAAVQNLLSGARRWRHAAGRGAVCLSAVALRSCLAPRRAAPRWRILLRPVAANIYRTHQTSRAPWRRWRGRRGSTSSRTGADMTARRSIWQQRRQRRGQRRHRTAAWQERASAGVA